MTTLLQQVGLVYVIGFGFEVLVLDRAPAPSLLIALWAPIAFYGFVRWARYLLRER